MAKKEKRKPSGLQPWRNNGPRIKRNQLCPCGSGKKAKRCCLKYIQALAALPSEQQERLIAESITQRAIGTIEEPTLIESAVDIADCQIQVSSEEKQL